MAHVGQLYKLWYRRDASWNLNNYKFAFPEAYSLFSHGFISSARYNVEVIDQYPAVNLNKSYDRTWVSQSSGGVFDNAYWKLEFRNEVYTQLDNFRFSIWHAAVIDTPLFSATYRKAESSPVYYNLPGGFMEELHFLSPDISVDPDRFQPRVIAARWNEYP
jgi:hypothetical protein